MNNPKEINSPLSSSELQTILGEKNHRESKGSGYFAASYFTIGNDVHLKLSNGNEVNGKVRALNNKYISVGDDDIALKHIVSVFSGK